MRDMADRFAAEGYAVCAPAIFDRAERGVELGYTQEDIDKGRGYRMKLDDAKVMADVEAAANHLAGKKLGIVGYCFGGTVAWWGATRTNKFAASSCWYGGGIAGTKDERPNCPVQMHFGEKDASIPMTDVEAVRAAQPKAETYVYMGAQHGFGCDERGSFSKPHIVSIVSPGSTWRSDFSARSASSTRPRMALEAIAMRRAGGQFGLTRRAIAAQLAASSSRPAMKCANAIALCVRNT